MNIESAILVPVRAAERQWIASLRRAEKLAVGARFLMGIVPLFSCVDCGKPLIQTIAVPPQDEHSQRRGTWLALDAQRGHFTI
jgi:hypothetical protein